MRLKQQDRLLKTVRATVAEHGRGKRERITTKPRTITTSANKEVDLPYQESPGSSVRSNKTVVATEVKTYRIQSPSRKKVKTNRNSPADKIIEVVQQNSLKKSAITLYSEQDDEYLPL